MMRYWVRRLAASPRLFDLLRWVLEGGYVKHRRLIRRSIGSQNQSVLDCGCGTGIYANCFAPEVYTGIDISQGYIKRCKQRCPRHQFHVMDATKLEFPDGSFSSAMISGVLHHLDDSQAHQVCKEVRRVLKPGGQLLIWEDIPTLSRWNWVGSVIHRLDLGEHIRLPHRYEEILAEHFTIQSRELLSSGVMDYLALICTKVSEEELAEGQLSTRPAIRDTLFTGGMAKEAGADRT